MVVSPYVEFDYGFITSNIHLRNQQTPIAYLVNVNERMLIPITGFFETNKQTQVLLLVYLMC